METINFLNYYLEFICPRLSECWDELASFVLLKLFFLFIDKFFTLIT
jgi:hypothetical protein